MNTAVKPNLAELSDEELVNLDPETLEEEVSTEEIPVSADDAKSPETVDIEEHEEEEQSPSDEPAAKEAEEEVDSPPSVEDIFYDQGSSATSEEAEETEEADPEDEADEETHAKPSGVDYKAEYENLLAPFRAAKREVNVNSVDDARRLMQMGVDYARKMEHMKPFQKALKTLERNDLISEDKINYIVDLIHNKNPEAIKKFLKDSDVDPLDLDLEDSINYQPTDNTVGDQELALEEVLDDIRETKSFDRTVDEVTNKFDTESKQILLKDPGLLKVINNHINVGIYDQITNIVEQERIHGRLQGLSDLAAYKTVGDAINAKGGFKPYQSNESSAGNPSQVSGSGSKDAARLRKRKRAASPTKGTGGKSKEVTNFLANLSDEEIEKMGPPT